LEDVESKTFIVPLSVERVWSSAFPQLSSLEATAGDRPRENRLRLDTAPRGGALGPGRGCRAFDFERRRGGRHEHQWRGASIREAGARKNRVSLTWGISKNVGIK